MTRVHGETDEGESSRWLRGRDKSSRATESVGESVSFESPRPTISMRDPFTMEKRGVARGMRAPWPRVAGYDHRVRT